MIEHNGILYNLSINVVEDNLIGVIRRRDKSKDQTIMLLFYLKSDYYAFYMQFCMSNSLHVADNIDRLFYWSVSLIHSNKTVFINIVCYI